MLEDKSNLRVEDLFLDSHHGSEEGMTHEVSWEDSATNPAQDTKGMSDQLGFKLS